MWTKVESSNLRALRYQDGTLSVLFKSNVIYDYSGVSQGVLDEIVNSESKGKTFHRLILSNPGMYPVLRHYPLEDDHAVSQSNQLSTRGEPTHNSAVDKFGAPTRL